MVCFKMWLNVCWFPARNGQRGVGCWGEGQVRRGEEGRGGSVLGVWRKGEGEMFPYIEEEERGKGRQDGNMITRLNVVRKFFCNA